MSINLRHTMTPVSEFFQEGSPIAKTNNSSQSSISYLGIKTLSSVMPLVTQFLTNEDKVNLAETSRTFNVMGDVLGRIKKLKKLLRKESSTESTQKMEIDQLPDHLINSLTVASVTPQSVNKRFAKELANLGKMHHPDLAIFLKLKRMSKDDQAIVDGDEIESIIKVGQSLLDSKIDFKLLDNATTAAKPALIIRQVIEDYSGNSLVHEKDLHVVSLLQSNEPTIEVITEILDKYGLEYFQLIKYIFDEMLEEEFMNIGSSALQEQFRVDYSGVVEIINQLPDTEDGRLTKNVINVAKFGEYYSLITTLINGSDSTKTEEKIKIAASLVKIWTKKINDKFFLEALVETIIKAYKDDVSNAATALKALSFSDQVIQYLPAFFKLALENGNVKSFCDVIDFFQIKSWSATSYKNLLLESRLFDQEFNTHDMIYLIKILPQRNLKAALLFNEVARILDGNHNRYHYKENKILRSKMRSLEKSLIEIARKKDDVLSKRFAILNSSEKSSEAIEKILLEEQKEHEKLDAIFTNRALSFLIEFFLESEERLLALQIFKEMTGDLQLKYAKRLIKLYVQDNKLNSARYVISQTKNEVDRKNLYEELNKLNALSINKSLDYFKQAFSV